MIYSVSFSWKMTQIIDEGVAMSFKNQFNNYIHCKKPTPKSFVTFLFSNGSAIIRNTMFLIIYLVL